MTMSMHANEEKLMQIVGRKTTRKTWVAKQQLLASQERGSVELVRATMAS
jgi:hypothetical protein